jgi:MoaA/NifB/PqqE/SkfB family radical SAM enzyme
MRWETFTRTVDQLLEFPRKLKAIRLYGFGEPLLNKMLPEMIAYTKDRAVTEFVEFTTNGWWLNPEVNQRLIAAGLDAITISIPGLDQARSLQSCGKKIDILAYLENIENFYIRSHGKCRIHIKMTNYKAGEEDIDLFYSLFGDVCDEISVDNVVPIWPDIAGELVEKDKNIYRGVIEPVQVCPYIFYHLTIHANGDVSTCFVDWQHLNAIGNVHTDTLLGIWNGWTLNQLRKDHLNGYRNNIYTLCSNCPQLIYGQPDNIDKCAKDILERLK